MERWVGKVALVTGASVGIGADIAQSLVKQGLKVVGVARRVEKIKELAEELKEEKGALYPLKCDVSKEQDILEVFSWIKEHLGEISILVNNAGIIQQTTLIQGDSAKWRKVFDVNVLGLCICTREAVRMMREKGVAGHIIHMNSIAGHGALNAPNVNVYSASKYAVTALTETIRQELKDAGTKIKVTSLSPGYTDTDICMTNDFLFDPVTAKRFRMMPFLRPEDISDAVTFILSTPAHVQVHELIIKPLGEST